GWVLALRMGGIALAPTGPVTGQRGQPEALLELDHVWYIVLAPNERPGDHPDPVVGGVHPIHALGEVHVLAAGDDGVVTRLGVVDGPEVAEVGGVWVHQLEDVVAVLYLRHVDHDGLALDGERAGRGEGILVGS